MILKENNETFQKRLSIPEMNKNVKRWDLFLSKLRNDKIFITYDDQKVNITNSEEIIDSITDECSGDLDLTKVKDFLKPRQRYAPVIKTNIGDLRLNDFSKTEEFGGGSGSSLGSFNAIKYETLQAMFFALRQYLGRDILVSDMHLLYGSDKNPEIFDYVKSTMIITEDDIKLFEDRGWVYTYIKTANTFFTELNPGKKYTFYHFYSGLGISDELFQAFNRNIKSVNTENLVKISMSRWNPSDIWAIETGEEDTSIESLKETTSLSELNNVVDDLFDSKILVGISLKKIPMDRRIELIVNKNLDTNFLYENSETSEGKFDTLTVRINAKSYSGLGQRKKEVLDARIYTGTEESNIFLEVRGKDTKYGKASLKYINSVLLRYGLEQIPTYKNILLTNEELIEKICDLYHTIPGLTTVSNYCNLPCNNISRIRSKLISKYQALLFVNLMETNKYNIHDRSLGSTFRNLFSNKNTVTNLVTEEIFYYAYSMGGKMFKNSKFYRIKTYKAD